MEKIAIITVVYNNYDVLVDFFASLDKQTDKNFEVFIADLSTKKQHITHQRLTLHILMTDNIGYSHGINTGLKEALKLGFTQFIAVNNDTVLDEALIEMSKKTITEHPASVIGGKIYYFSGYEYHKTKYKQEELGKVIWYAGGILDWKNVFTKHRGVDEVDNGQYDQFEKTEFITGCFMLFDKTIIDRVGLWDDSYFLYYEDADFCERAKRMNFSLFYDPMLILWHKNAQSTEGSGSKLHQRYQEKNRVKFGLKYAPLRTKIHLVKNLFFG